MTEEEGPAAAQLWVWPRKRAGRRASGPHRSGAEGLLKAVNHNQGVQPSLLWGQASEVCHTGKPRPGELPGSISPEASTKEAARGSPTQLRLESEKQTVVPPPPGSSSAHGGALACHPRCERSTPACRLEQLWSPRRPCTSSARHGSTLTVTCEDPPRTTPTFHLRELSLQKKTLCPEGKGPGQMATDTEHSPAEANLKPPKRGPATEARLTETHQEPCPGSGQESRGEGSRRNGPITRSREESIQSIESSFRPLTENGN